MKKNLFLLSILGFALTINLSSATPLTVTLTPTNISCFGGRNGAVNITVSGGTFPYTYVWSTQATTQNISGLAAGYYAVTVTDAALATATGNVTLTEPTPLTLNLAPSVYNSVNNISCYNCCNGYINSSVTGGTTSYTYSWTSINATITTPTAANLSNLCIGVYILTVTDAHGCTKSASQTMTQPDKDTWTMTGNSASNPSSQFIGNTDSVDLSFRTNNSERFRIKGNGDLKIPSLAGTGDRIVQADANGLLKTVPWLSDWHVTGNAGINSSTNFMGTTDGHDLRIRTNNTEKMSITTSGNIGIGTIDPQQWSFLIAGMPSNRILHIEGERPSLRLSNTLDNVDMSIMTANGSAIIESSGSVHVFLDAANTPGLTSEAFYIFHDKINNSPVTEPLFKVGGNGNVGIGTNSPKTTLDVRGSVNLQDGNNAGVVYFPLTGGNLYFRSDDNPPDYEQSSERMTIGGDGTVTMYGSLHIAAPLTPDFVFDNNYKPISWRDKELFYQNNCHLPYVASAATSEQEGFDVGKNYAGLLQNVEEDRLDITELFKRMEKIEVQNAELRKQNELLQKEIELLKK